MVTFGGHSRVVRGTGEGTRDNFEVTHSARGNPPYTCVLTGVGVGVGVDCVVCVLCCEVLLAVQFRRPGQGHDTELSNPSAPGLRQAAALLGWMRGLEPVAFLAAQ